MNNDGLFVIPGLTRNIEFAHRLAGDPKKVG